MKYHSSCKLQPKTWRKHTALVRFAAIRTWRSLMMSWKERLGLERWNRGFWEGGDEDDLRLEDCNWWSRFRQSMPLSWRTISLGLAEPKGLGLLVGFCWWRRWAWAFSSSSSSFSTSSAHEKRPLVFLSIFPSLSLSLDGSLKFKCQRSSREKKHISSVFGPRARVLWHVLGP